MVLLTLLVLAACGQAQTLDVDCWVKELIVTPPVTLPDSVDVSYTIITQGPDSTLTAGLGVQFLINNNPVPNMSATLLGITVQHQDGRIYIDAGDSLQVVIMPEEGWNAANNELKKHIPDGWGGAAAIPARRIPNRSTSPTPRIREPPWTSSA